MKLDDLTTDSMLPIFDSYVLDSYAHPNDLGSQTLYAKSDVFDIWIDYNSKGVRYELWIRPEDGIDWVACPGLEHWKWINLAKDIPLAVQKIAESILGHKPQLS